MAPSLLLKALCSPEYVRKVAFVSTFAAMRIAIRRTDEFRELTDDLRSGGLTDAEIEAFANSLFAEYRKGERFKFEEAIATLAVLLETHPSKFADEFLSQLAAFRSSGLVMAAGVARESLRLRKEQVPSSAIHGPLVVSPEGK